jgi:hypothetical protein
MLFGRSLNPWADILILLVVGTVMIGLAAGAFSTQE